MAKKKILRITAKVDGFRRCGIAHSAAGKDHPREAFTDDEIRRLQKEPNLVVQELTVDVKDDSDGSQAEQSGQGGQGGGQQ